MKYTEADKYFLQEGHSNTILKDSEKRCRFCGRTMPIVTFKQDAHAVAEMFGNRKIFSEYECDSCNEKFSVFEGELAEYTHLYRGLRGVKGKKKPTKIDRGVTSAFDFKNRNFSFSLEESDRKTKEFNVFRSANSCLFTYVSKYIPISVYKALLKFALCVLDEKTFNKYKNYCDFLNTTDFNAISPESLNIYTIVLKEPISSPTIRVYKNESILYVGPKVYVSIEFYQFVYNIFLFQGNETLEMFKNETDFYKILNGNNYDIYSIRVKNLSSQNRTNETHIEEISGRII